jgi:hypothetical protein
VIRRIGFGIQQFLFYFNFRLKGRSWRHKDLPEWRDAASSQQPAASSQLHWLYGVLRTE